MKIVFMGTPDFAVSALEKIINVHDVAAVFTQPDKPKNRGKKILFSPVKECALKHGIPVYQPLSLKKGEDADNAFEILKKLSPDCIVVAAYGQILPENILNCAKYGCVNIHASLLPKYRGAAPIQKCIIDGEISSGVTTMLMEKGLDTGDIIESSEVEISDVMTAGELHDVLAEVGGELILSTLEKLENGTASLVKQDDSASSYAGTISKEMCLIDFSRSAKDVYNFIRGMSPSPCAYTIIGDKRLKVYFCEKIECISSEPYGTVIDNELTIVCGDGNCVKLSSVQGEGGKRMSACDYLRGNKIEKGTRTV